MASDKGTGRHPHKSTAEPYPRTKEARTGHGGRDGESQSASRSANENRGGGDMQHGSRGSERSSNESQQASRGSDDLKSREYRGSDGEIHHHTRTYGEQHNKK